MDKNDSYLNVRYNVMNMTLLITFANVKGGLNRMCKDVYFIRYIGHDSNYISDIRKMDQMLTERELSGTGKYIRIQELPRLAAYEDTEYYTFVYDEWKNSDGNSIRLKSFNTQLQGDNHFNRMLSNAVENTCAQFKNSSQNVSESMLKNFVIKLMYWCDAAAGSFIEHWSERESYKFVYCGTVKKQEYLFLYFLTLLGIDVCLLCPSGEAALDDTLLNLSKAVVFDDCTEVMMPVYDRAEYTAKKEAVQRIPVNQNITEVTTISHDTPSHASQNQNTNGSERIRVNIQRPKQLDKQQQFSVSSSRNSAANTELSFEEIAQLASSIVMITIHNASDTVIGTGSGIMVGRQGYILTNNHVASGGAYYTVRIEDDDETYVTEEVIKYNQLLDLALIRIGRVLKPLHIYKGENKLARGQRVVAIGSPLGLFNSVSDGIISGFREIDHVQMIQFTAPISHGSSGGALINMSGEVIGISTAGIDSGQNINLAVDYRDIAMFVRGFV